MPSVLVLDDNQEYRQIMAMMVRRAGYRVTQSEKNAALEKTRTDPPALILMELTADTTKDFRLTAQLQSDPLSSDFPILYYAKEEIKSRMNGEAAKILVKPISAAAVAETLRKHLSAPPNRPRPIASPTFDSSK